MIGKSNIRRALWHAAGPQIGSVSAEAVAETVAGAENRGQCSDCNFDSDSAATLWQLHAYFHTTQSRTHTHSVAQYRNKMA